jgi:hypothetical protein
MNIYRKIYEENIGPIPKDELGRSYHIHHIDGNRKNNSVENLLAVSIEEHYNIHYSQGDYGACFKLSRLLKMTQEQLENIAKLHVEKQLKDKKHPFQGGNVQRKNAKKQLENGTHNFQKMNLSEHAKKRITKEGFDHPFNKKTACPNCGKIGQAGGMTRHIKSCMS